MGEEAEEWCGARLSGLLLLNTREKANGTLFEQSLRVPLFVGDVNGILCDTKKVQPGGKYLFQKAH